MINETIYLQLLVPWGAPIQSKQLKNQLVSSTVFILLSRPLELGYLMIKNMTTR